MKYWQFLIFTILCHVTDGHAFVPAEMVLPEGNISFITPTILNNRYFRFEIGYVVDKKIKSIDYNFNAFVEAILGEETYAKDENVRAGSLGGKGGLLLPTQPWIPFYLYMATGYAKAALHGDPWLGKKEDSIALKDMFLAEGGALFTYNRRVLFRYSYEVTTVKFFKKKSFFSIGMSF